MKKLLVLYICCFLSFIVLACESNEEGNFKQEEFELLIDTLPYRGAVLFINYNGETDIAEHELVVDIVLKDTVMQEEMPVEYVDGNMVAEIVDLMYLPGDELDFVLKIRKGKSEILECHHSEKLKRYPWKDWMLADDEYFSLGSIDNFIYGVPSYVGVGAHSSWDYWTTIGKEINVYANTKGIFYTVTPDPNNPGLSIDNLADFTIYNPYVGGIIQFGHCYPLAHIKAGEEVVLGEHIAGIQWDHIHYSVYRPQNYTNNPSKVILGIDTYEFIPPDKWEKYYWPLPYNEDGYGDHTVYNDPFYWHEPTTLGYWNEETLPPGLKEEMLMMFQEYNPDVELPATSPLNNETIN
jgi:hypothetical protein